MLYEVKLINPETKEVYFTSLATKPQFPPQKLRDQYKAAIIVVRTMIG
ncbi:MAG: hypothetical protein ACJ76H_04735 [Bacteriovoracaceae bacterium]